MAKALKKIIYQIFDVGVGSDAVYSVFNKQLTEEECEKELMYHTDINSFERYKIFKTREYNYLKLLVELNEHLQLEYIDLKTDKVVNNTMDFHFMFILLENHFFRDKKVLFRVAEKDTFILLSYDFNIFIYFINDLHKELKRIFKKHHFHLLYYRK